MQGHNRKKADLSESIEARRQWNCSFKVLEEKTKSTQIVRFSKNPSKKLI